MTSCIGGCFAASLAGLFLFSFVFRLSNYCDVLNVATIGLSDLKSIALQNNRITLDFSVASRVQFSASE